MPFNVIQMPTDITGPIFGIIDPQQIATLSDGDFVLVYDASTGSSVDVFSAVFGPLGQPVGSADTTQSLIEQLPVVTTLAGGGYALAWQGFQAGPSDLFTAVFNAQGQQTSVPVDVSNGAGNGAVVFPVLTSLSTGGYAATWQNGDIFTAIYDAQGQRVVGPIDVSNTPADTGDNIADVAALSNGNYALAWTNATDGSVLTSVYSAQGLPVAPAAIVTNAGVTFQGDVRIAALSNGDYALTWDGAIGVTDEIFTAVYDGQGHQVVAPIDVGSGFEPQVAALSNGDYALVWTSVGVGGVFAAVYDAQGQPLSAPVTVSTGGGQDNATKVVALSNGDYALTWYGDTGGGFTDVFTAVYSSQGQQLVAPIDVSNSPNIYDLNSTTTALANGSYVISWQSTAGDGFTDVSTAIYQFVDPNITPGDVSVIGSSDIAIDLSALVKLGGSLTVANNGAAVSINLSNLESIGGNFVLSGNGAVLTVTVPNLTSVTGSVTLDGNSSATIIDAGSLTTTGSVEISGNTSATIVNMSGLTSVTGSVTLNDNPSATAIALPSLTSVTGSVTLDGNSSATIIDAGSLTTTGSVEISGNTSATIVNISGLTSVTGSVTLNDNPSATAIALPSLTSVTGSVTLDGNSSATIIDAGSLTTTGSVEISGNTSATIVNMSGLTSVTGSVTLDGNSSATIIDAGSLTTTGSVEISGNTTVITIDLGALIQAGGIIIADNGVITLDLSALVKVGGNVEITNNDSLLTVDMPNLTDVSGDVNVSGNDSATGVTMHALSNVGGDLTISNNSSATVIDVSSVTTVGGTLTLSGDTGATVIDVANLTTVGGDLTISNDSSATVIDISSVTTVGGTLTLSGDTGATVIDVANVTTVGGDLTISNDSSATVIDVSSVTTVGGTLTLSGDTGATVIDVANLTTVGGDLTISNDSSATVIDVSSVTTVGGTLTLSGDTGATVIDVANVTTVGGDLTISSDSSATVIDVSSVTTVGGNLTIDSGADATLDASALGPGGGNVALVGNNLTTTISLGGLDHLQGTLTITSADGVMLTAKAGLAEINITGTASDDTLIGSTKAANTMDGGGGNDSLTGGSADDVITGGAGNDTLDGKGGTNAAVYSGNFSDYDIVQNADGSLTVTDTRANSPDGTDTLRNFELFKFADGTHTLADVLPSPVITSNGGGDTAAISTPENTAAVTQIAATDPNAAQTLVFAITGGADAAKFQIDPASGALSFVTAPNFEAPSDVGGNNVYDVTVQVSDGFHFDTQALAVTVTNVNEAPVVAALNGTVGEDGPSFGSDLLTGATDPDQGTVLTVQNLDASVTTTGGRSLALGTDYTLNGSALALTAVGFAKFNSLSGSQTDQAVFHFGVSDGVAATADTLTLSVIGANDAPLVVPQTANVGEDGPSFGSDLLTGAADPDQGTVLTVQNLDASVTTTGGRTLALGTDYTLNGSALALTAVGFAKFNGLSGSQTDQAVFHFGVSDGIVATSDTLTLSIIGANDTPVLASQTADQSTSAGTPFSLILSANTFHDPDSGDHLTLAATAGNGTALPAWLSFNPTTGAFSGTAGLGDVGAFDVTVTATDTGSLTATDTFHFSVTAPSTDHPPVITSDGGGDAASIIITDNSKYVATVHAVDPDLGTTLAYSIVGGSDQKLFAIDSNTGVLSFKSTPQDGHSYQVTVAASDGSLRDTQAIAVHVANGPLEFSNPGVADTFVFKTHFGLEVVNNFDPTSANHDVIQFDHSLFHNADVNASPGAILNLIQDHSYQLGRDLFIVTDTHDVIDLRNTSLHSLTAHDFILT